MYVSFYTNHSFYYLKKPQFTIILTSGLKNRLYETHLIFRKTKIKSYVQN